MALFGPGFQLLAATPAAGFSLQNGTPSLLTWTPPADGQLHRVLVIVDYLVTVNASGGQLNFQFDDPGGNFQSRELVAGGGTSGFQTVFGPPCYLVQPGEEIFLVQTALTGGAATVWAEIWGIVMTQQLTLQESNGVTLNGSGNGTVQLGPTGPNEVWTPTGVSVQCSSNVAEATCKVYVGPTATPPYFVDITVDGSTGDVTDQCNTPITKGLYVWAIWSGGDVGATATLNVNGTKTVP